MPVKAIVAVHGIGDQTQYATAQNVVAQFSLYHRVGMAVPLGRFHGSTQGPIIQMACPPDPGPMEGLAFAEVYWAGIPREVVDKGFQLEETKAWARTISNRLVQRAAMAKNPMPKREHRRLVTVVDEMVETIKILERLNFLASKAGLFTFNLGTLMRTFVGDVQIVADFPARRKEILKQFDDVMKGVIKLGNPAGDVEVYLVAHSEGSVVAFLALLQALADPDTYPWIKAVKGLMTIGSPIETHQLFWPELWSDLKPSAKVKIPWKNYLDHGDPIAYELTQTKQWLKDSGFAPNFELEEIPFSRSLLPGKAHNDYWEDEQVFGHFIDNVMFKGRPPEKDRQVTKRPGNSLLARLVCNSLPHMLVASLLLLATYLLYRPILNALGSDQGRLEMFQDVAGIGLLLFGVTAASRIPRLTPAKHLWLLGALALAVSMWLYGAVVSAGTRVALGGTFKDWQFWPWLQWRDAETTGVLLAALGVAAVGAALSSWFPRYGVRLLPGLGLACAAVLCIELLSTADKDVEAWPIVLGGIAFFYLWWLAALLFDLAFVWQRYVRYSMACKGAAAISARGYEPTLLEKSMPALKGAPAGRS